MSVLNALVKKGIVKESDIPAIESEAQDAGGDIEAILQKRGIDNAHILEALGEYHNMPTRSVNENDISGDVLSYIPEESALHYQFVPLGLNDSVLEVGVVDPDNVEARDVLSFIASKNNFPFKIFLITRTDFEKVVQSYRNLSGEVTKALSELESEINADSKELEKKKGKEVEVEKQEGDTKIIEDAPVTKIVATVLHYAVEGNASDVHIEPMADKVRVRFRVDGVLHISLLLPSKVHNAVVARIKILSAMRLDEKRKPQDGRFSARIAGRKIDFRVSTFPSYYGEKIVMRILDSEKGGKKLDDMGLSPRNLKAIRSAIDRPYGMILISGPTGSGKSTTLYSMLAELDRERFNVLSLEDPVEYNMEGMSQSQVRPEIGYTFATGLRTTLRQDPDIIMVGEIRDKETAKLAVQAALTGHLVLSTIHTNNSVGVIPRLINMGVEPYLIAPTLILAIAQRLVKKLCPGAGKAIPVEGSVSMMLEKQFADLPDEFRSEIPEAKEIFEATPTSECPNSTRGRAAVMEVLEMDKDLELAVLQGASEQEIKKILRNKGMFSMKEDAIIRALRGEIPFEEVNAL
ncbi:MAG: ATPase, T2SS/T4P/T4SS family [Candidatus Paceibacterota bacterium]